MYKCDENYTTSNAQNVTLRCKKGKKIEVWRGGRQLTRLWTVGDFYSFHLTYECDEKWHNQKCKNVTLRCKKCKECETKKLKFEVGGQLRRLRTASDLIKTYLFHLTYKCDEKWHKQQTYHKGSIMMPYRLWLILMGYFMIINWWQINIKPIKFLKEEWLQERIDNW